jgi:hypothetical protein
VVAAPIFYPILVPAYQFQYVAPCVTQQTIIGGQPNLSNAPMSALPNQNDKIKELAKALLEEMNRQSDNINDDGPPMAQGPYVGQVQFTNNNLTNVGLIALAKNCSSCHTGIGSKGEFIMFSQPGVLNPNVSWEKIREAVKLHKMPPNDSQFKLTVDEYSAILNMTNNFGR